MNWFRKLRGMGDVAPNDEPEDVEQDEAPESLHNGVFSTHMEMAVRTERGVSLNAVMVNLKKWAHATKIWEPEHAMDSVDSQGEPTNKVFNSFLQPNVSETLLTWYGTQSFIGWQLCAIMAQHWLIDKACTMPARDAIRHGFRTVSATNDDLPDEVVTMLDKADKKYSLRKNMLQFIRHGRIFGIRIVIFKVISPDPDYYEKPFNPDGIPRGGYRGMVQIDPYWCSPILDQNASANPDTMHFYEPTWWQVNGVKYHRSHLVIFRNSELTDLLKPSYQYGGIPIPQKIYERVYAAERVANEAPQLALSKRTTFFKTDLSAVAGKAVNFAKRMAEWVYNRDNYGVKIMGKDDEMSQADTALADFDALIMTQYQIVAAAAGVPATKLLGTQPKGFSATGEFDEKSYHEELESIQEHDLTALAERHHLMVMRSAGLKQYETTVAWEPVDSPSARDQADTQYVKSQTDLNNVNMGAIDGADVRAKLIADPDSGYNDLGDIDPSEEPTDLLGNPLGAQ